MGATEQTGHSASERHNGAAYCLNEDKPSKSVAEESDAAVFAVEKNVGRNPLDVAWKLYTSHALSAWGERMWEFAGSLVSILMIVTSEGQEFDECYTQVAESSVSHLHEHLIYQSWSSLYMWYTPMTVILFISLLIAGCAKSLPAIWTQIR